MVDKVDNNCLLLNKPLNQNCLCKDYYVLNGKQHILSGMGVAGC